MQSPSRSGHKSNRQVIRQHALAFLFFLAIAVAFFSPAILSGRLLAPADGMMFYLPHYQMPFTLWNPNSMTGFPEFGDPQVMKWYWPALLLSQIPGSWNLFVLAAYVLAGWFTYLYVRSLLGAGFAALVAGVVFSLCGFMIGHLGHTSMIHAAAWVPCMLWAAEELTRGFRFRWVLLGGVAASQTVLAGHPQIALYGLALAIAYAAFRSLSAQSRLRYCAAFGSALVLGLMLSAVQTFATAATATVTTRARMSFEQFSEYSLSAHQLALLVFPCLFGGGSAAGVDGIPYFAAWNLTEITGYVGLGIGVLALIGILSRYRDRVTVFWGGVAVVALLAAMGSTTPLGRLIYHLPGFGQFRAQGRFMYIFCFAAAVLAAEGIVAITKRPGRFRDWALTVGAFLALLAAAMLIGPLFGERLRAAAASQGYPNLPLSIVSNRWIGLPVLSGFFVAIALVVFIYRPTSYPARILVIAGSIVELGTFGWYAEWRFASPTAAQMQPPEVVKEYAQKLKASGGRWLAVRGSQGTLAEAPPDLAALWDVPAIGKYGPLQPARYRELLGIESNGFVFGDWWDPMNRAFDITGARMVAFPEPPIAPNTEMFHGIPFPADDINLMAGHGCGSSASTGKLALGQRRRATAVGIVTLMGCSTALTDHTPVLEMNLRGDADRSATMILRAGVDTSEWAAGCADVSSLIRHRAAEVYSRFPVPRGAATCQGQRYGTLLDIPGGAMDVQSIDFRWLPQSEGVLRVVKLVFIDAPSKKVEAVRTTDFWVGDASRWKEFKRARDVLVYENLRAMPRTWLVAETLTLAPEAIRQAIKTSQLPDGRAYDPSAIALIEDTLGFRSPQPEPDARAWVVSDNGSSLEVRTANKQPAFLVLGDLDFPGWTVSINGTPSKVFQTNYIQRGVLLPAGQNLVRFEFRPPNFYAGVGVSATGILLSLLGAFMATLRGLW